MEGQTENRQRVREALSANINKWVIPWLQKFVEVPNTSRNFDPAWATNGLLEQACQVCLDYGTAIAVKGYSTAMHKPEGAQTPLVFGRVEATRPNARKIMVYGHLDKQPHMTEKWSEGLGPCLPVIKNGKLYGRGAADDGYNFFTILAILKTLQELDIPHDEYILFYECDEESCSIDIPFYLDKFKDTIGSPDVLFCLDSGSVSCQVLGITTALRGCITVDFSVKVLKTGIHSGLGSGLVPSTFRIARKLLDRLEDSETGKLIDGLQVSIPQDKMEQAVIGTKILGEKFWQVYPFLEGVKPVSDDCMEAYLNTVWRSQLEVIGQSGIPNSQECGNVLRDETLLRLSIRLAPTLISSEAFKIVKELLEKDPPYDAHVKVTMIDDGDGWNSNPFPEVVTQLLHKNALEVFQTPALMFGGGGSIPFIKVLQDHLPKTLLFVSGIVLPDSAIHCPDECLHLEFLEKFTHSMVGFLMDYAHVPISN